MKNLRRVGLALGAVVALAGGASVVAVGCGGDDTAVTVTPDGGEGGTVDAQVDTGTDAGADTGKDTGTDTGPRFDAGPVSLATYVHQVNRLFCQRLALCCAGGPANWNVDSCTNDFDNSPQSFGFQGNRPIAPYLDGGHIALDTSKATACFDELNNMLCGQISASAWLQARNDCLAGAVGNIPVGTAGCRGSAECVAPAHCDIAADASTGTCAAPREAGAPCGPATDGFGSYVAAQEQCGQLMTGVPRRCDTAYDVPLTDGGTETNTCTAQKDIDASCYNDLECLSGVCGDAPDIVRQNDGFGACSSFRAAIIDQFTCNLYKLDAGHD